MNPPPSLDSLSRPPDDTRKPVWKIPAWTLPVAIAAGFAVLFFALFRDRLLPAPEVKVATVIAQPGERPRPASTSKSGPSGPLLFQASGWIEPDPLPVKATSLVDGVIDAVHVLEGQLVEKGDVLASLIDEDANLALATAEQRVRILNSSRASHVASIDVVRQKLEGSKALQLAAASLRDEADDRLKRLEGLASGAISESDVVSVRLKAAREASQHLAAESSSAEIEAELRRLELETQVRDDEIAAATIDVKKAQLALSRTRVTAPSDGRVLRLLAAPGQKKMLQDNDSESSTIAILYQPLKLQVRVDVPLADAAGLQTGQPARIRCSLLPDTLFTGVVTRINGEADLQRNTLQAKVSISNPVDQLRPEMLCRVEFLAMAPGPQSTFGTASAGELETWVPEAALNADGVWICDPETKRVTLRRVQPPADVRGGYAFVSEGLRPGEWVVISPQDLREGQRVNPTLIER